MFSFWGGGGVHLGIVLANKYLSSKKFQQLMARKKGRGQVEVYCFLFVSLFSAAIVLSGKLTLDAFHCSSGVLLNESISTSTEMQGNVTYNEKDGLKSHINVTEKPQEILNIT